ncbi:hypothetical protein HMPREF0204_10092 [Chryseobacterium gleum ATCC 35910]|uniref:Uncharacterized protein n=1 Tax=Chryseobacterium gleum ATCC 35910 TaxID=525257 RepID=A0ABP2IWK1_CHRGE|nr:hypothetical protein HMPREF0204_10092 [Chryseobacterium gleum ATCC 35910]
MVKSQKLSSYKIETIMINKSGLKPAHFIFNLPLALAKTYFN